jgi:hypothetical protein
MANHHQLAIRGITSCTRYRSGEIEDCRVKEPNVIHTIHGDFIPRYSSPGIRSKDLKSLSFYESGAIKIISLEERTEVKTPLGPMPAELVTFHSDGSLDSVFPLNGQIGFSWSIEEEAKLSPIFDFDFQFAKFSAKIIGIRFYESGAPKSLILWPGEVVALQTPLGGHLARIGFRMHEDGSLESFEPAVPIALKTPIGEAVAFDVSAIGSDADLNSVRFDWDGKLKRIATSGDIVVRRRDGVRVMFSSKTRPGLLDDSHVKLPISLSFIEKSVIIDDGAKSAGFKINECSFLLLPDFTMAEMECNGSCDGCSGCA